MDGLGAYPLLYAREETAAPFDSEAAYDLACYPTDGGEPCEPYRHLVTDGTEEGYFQLVLMLIMGSQFYLDWHAGYNDLEVVASPDRLETLIEEIGANDFGFPLTDEQARAVRRLDPAPVIRDRRFRGKESVCWCSPNGVGFIAITLHSACLRPMRFWISPLKRWWITIAALCTEPVASETG